jgi:hypothetical protein
MPQPPSALSKAQRDQIADLLARTMMTFFNAYYLHASGTSETELMIDHDITAAGCGACKHCSAVSRLTIKTAIAAVDEGIPFQVAQSQLASRINKNIDRLLRRTAARQS